MSQMNNITDSESFKFKLELLDNTNNYSITHAKMVEPLKYISNFWRTVKALKTVKELN